MFRKLALAGTMVAALTLAALAATPLHTYNNSVGHEQETIGVHCINNTTGEPESCGAGGGGGGDATAANQTSVQTPAAPGTATSTKGVRGGGQYHTTPVTLTNAQEAGDEFGPHGEKKTCQVDSSGNCAYPTATTVVVQSSQYPNGATAISASSGNVANAAAAATLAGTASKTTYITGFRCGGAGATGALVVNITVTGMISGTQTYTFAAVAGVALIDQPVERQFVPAIPASAVNTAIVVTLPALGAGNTNATCNAEGYQL